MVFKHFSDKGLVIRYIIAGSIGAFVNLVSMYILTGVLQIWYVSSATLAFIVSLLVTFFIQKMWTFGDTLFQTKHAMRQAFFYTLSSVSFLVLNIVILYVLVEFFHLWYLFAQFISLGSVALGSFLFNKTVTFPTVK